MKRISNPVPVYSLFAWPVVMLAFVIWAFIQVQNGDSNGVKYIIIMAVIVVYRRLFMNPVMVLEGPSSIVLKQGRQSEEIAFSQISSVEVRGRTVSITTTNPKFPRATFLPATVSLLSTGRARREALEKFVSEFSARIGR